MMMMMVLLLALHMMTCFKYSRYFLTKSLEKLFVPARDQTRPERRACRGEIKKMLSAWSESAALTGCN
jgi:hypothetical protein